MSKMPEVELLPPEKVSALDRLADLVADRLAQRSSLPRPAAEKPGKPLAELTEEVLVEPWFLPREIAHEILRLLPLTHRRKWAYYFAEHGCLRCSRTNLVHMGNGLCNDCTQQVRKRLKTAIKQAESDWKEKL